ncbi:helix-turn-helix domain-containing protein [Pseudonocardia lacus]|uniref:helix-turn-helix domain-containing protein n=1 Tax=Pseudonocardia lacus TaxID=2835865 RepID=UPI001BDBDC6D|nr:helix-turn-helix transcriptional regulator [Pseudonocardia lacus]
MSDNESETDGAGAAEAALAAEIRRRRQAAGLSQAQLASAVGYTREYVSRAEQPSKGLVSVALVEGIDNALEAGGALIELRERVEVHRLHRRSRGRVPRQPGRNLNTALPASSSGTNVDPVAARRSATGADSTGLPSSLAKDCDVGQPEDDGLIALAARAELSDVGAAAIDTAEEVAELLARAYATTPPAQLLAELRHRAAEVSALLDRRSTLAQRRRLLVIGGWLALLGATVYVDLGDRARAAGARSAAASLGRETENPELVAWAVEIETWTALIDQRWQRAAQLAAAGEALAPARSSAAVQLAAQSARAAARLGDRATVRAGLDRAAVDVDRQTGDRPRDHHFVFDGRKVEGYTATALAWLGDPAGEAVAREVAERYSAGPARRLATARIDLGLILAREGRPDEAAHMGLLAADSGRLVPSNAWRVAELDELLAPRRDVAEVAELHRRTTAEDSGDFS